MSKLKMWAGGFLVVVVVGSCTSAFGDDEPAVTTSTRADTGVVGVQAPAPQIPVRLDEPTQESETVTVERVIDGDTFALDDGRKVRVLGIDSCEKGTYGGDQALSDAERHLTLLDPVIELTSEPGVDTDQLGRILRYVAFDGKDFGTEMVQWDHTGVYQGENDASFEYIDSLYLADTKYSFNPPSGRECGGQVPGPTSGGMTEFGNGPDDDDVNLPDGALTGGYCAKKWWC